MLVDEFVKRAHSIEPWGAAAVDAAVVIKQRLSARGILIGNNDIAIAGAFHGFKCDLSHEQYKRVFPDLWADL